MPTLITRGALSGKGFGLTNEVAPVIPNLQTKTFTSNSNWIAPATTTSLVSLTGKGQDQIPSYAFDLGVGEYYVNAPGGSGTNPPYLDWSTVYGYATSMRSLYTSYIGINGPNNTSIVNDYFAFVYSNDSWNIQNFSTGTNTSLYTVNSVRIENFSAYSPPTSGNITYSSIVGLGPIGWVVIANLNAPPTNGSSSSAFGYTFPGGTSSSPTAPTLTYSNVPVTPGVSYAITVPSGGSITIQYYV